MSQATVYTFDEDTVSDLHKDVYKCRPSEQFWRNWKSFTDDQKQAEWDYLLKALQRTIAEENERELRAIARFEATVATSIASGAGDRATAIRWLMDSDTVAAGDVEFFEYNNGIPYGYVKETAYGGFGK